MRLVVSLFFCVWSCFFSPLLGAKNTPFLIHSEIHKIFLKADGTGTQEQTIDIELLTQEAANLITPYTVEYDPALKEIEVAEAYVIQPDGSKTSVGPDAIFTRPSLASTSSPGFVHTLTLSIVFPNLQVGSRIKYTLKGTIKKQGPFGFLWQGMPPFFHNQKKCKFELHVPLSQDFPLYVAQKGDLYGVTDEENQEKKERVITASFSNWKACEAEPNMAPAATWLPYFLVTSLKKWKDIADIYAQENDPQCIVTPAITSLAQSIVGSKQGEEAVRALYDWVAKNITYLFVSVDPLTGIKSHTSVEILQHKYGDCKDNVTLLRTLLKAINVESIPVLVDASGSIRDFPLLPYPFFNHVILYIPSLDVFADPTNQFAALGDLSFSLYDTAVLFTKGDIPEQKIPPLAIENNLFKTTTTLSFSKDGSLEGKSQLETKGYAAMSYRSFFCRPGVRPEEIGREVLRMTPEGGTGTFKTGDIYALTPSFSFTGSWTTPKLLMLNNAPSFPIPYGLDPTLSLPFVRDLFTENPRKYPFQTLPGIDSWEYTLTPPEGYQFDRAPENCSLETPAAFYQSTYRLEKNKLHVSRLFKIKKGFFLPEETPHLMQPVELLLFDLRQPVVLKKVEQSQERDPEINSG